jgi:hypothetical protein
MPPRTRQAVMVTMLVLYGSVSLVGAGVHALTEIGISHPSPDPSDQGAGPQLKALSGHCAICEFQAQGQLATKPTSVVCHPHTSPHVALILALIATRHRHPSCSPRAPPSLLSSATCA